MAGAEGIKVIPTLVLFRNGKAVGSITAPGSKAEIDRFIQELGEITEGSDMNNNHVYDMIVVGEGLHIIRPLSRIHCTLSWRLGLRAPHRAAE